MEYPRILFQLSDNESFVPHAGFSNIATDSLERLFEESRRATSLIEDELRKRDSNLRPGKRVSQILLKLRKDADLIKLRGRLDRRSNACAADLLHLMTTPPPDRNVRVFQEFLTDVLQQCSPQCTFLSGIIIGKHKIANLRDEERALLLRLLKIEKDSLSVEPFSSLASQYGIVKPRSRIDLFANRCLVNNANFVNSRYIQ